MSTKKQKQEAVNEAISVNFSSDLQYVVNALNSYKEMNFVFYTKENKFACISTVDQTCLLLNGQAFLMKAHDIYKETYNRESFFLNDLEGKNESNAIKSLRAKLDIIDNITHLPNFERETGVIYDVNGVKIYNQYNPDANVLKLKEEVEFEPRLTDISEFNISKYKEIAFLIKYLTNDHENPAFDYNTETSKYDKHVSLSQKFMHFLAALVQTNKKLALSWTFQSKVQGVGKDLMFNELFKPLIGKDFISGINKDTVIKTHNSAIDNKLLCILNECEIDNKKDRMTFNANMKEWITNDEILIRKMNVDQDYKKNYTNFLIYCNSEVPYHIESNCRRNTIIRTPNIKLDAAVKQTFNIGMDEFIDNIRKTRNEFIKDLLRFDFDMSFIYNKAPMTEAKKAIIMKTNTLGSIVSNYMLTNNQEELKQFLLETAEMNEADVDEICNEVKCGYISNESLKLLYEPLQGLEPDETSKTKKNVYFERLFSAKQQKINLNLNNGSVKQIRCFKFAHYNKALAETFLNNDSEYFKTASELAEGSIDFSKFMSSF